MLPAALVVCYSPCMSIKCGHCQGRHERLEEVRACSRAAHERRETPSDGANRMARTIAAALQSTEVQACGCPPHPLFGHRDGCRYEGMGRIVNATESAPEDPAWAEVGAKYAAAQRPAQARQEGTLAEEGVYRKGGKIYRVVTKGGRRFAEVMVGHAYVYARGMVYRLGPADRLTLEQAKAWGLQEVRCIRCGTALEREDSRAAGIGPVCATKI